MKKLLLLLTLLIAHYSVKSQCSAVPSIVQINQSCGGACSGVIGVAFSGGVLPLQVTLLGGAQPIGPMTATSFWQMGNLCPGSYELIIVDANGDTCNSLLFSIIPFPSPDATIITSNASCSSCNDGAATISNVTGGTPPYTYQWTPGGPVGPTLTGLAPGTYNVWVIDANGCIDVDTFQIGVGAAGYYTVGGQVYYDTNQNGIKDGGEPGIGNQQVAVTPGPVNAITNNLGDYAVVVAPGTYDATWQASPGWSLTSSPSTQTAIVNTASVGGLDFGLYPDSSYSSAVVSLNSNFPRCFWDVPYYIHIHNNGFSVLNGSVVLTHDASMTYVSSSINPFSQIGNQLTYTFAGLGPGQTLTISATFNLPAGGTSITNSVAMNATGNTGGQIAQNTSLTQTVSCSFDPNDKQVFPVGQGQLNYVTMDEWLTYQIRFQNTGTDTAFRVVIIDTLDAALDLNTFTLLGSSHPVQVTMRPGNEVSFIHDNILLPDSNVNEPASHGYVLYRIKGLATNPDPTMVYNTAYIYFDLNSPVQTNTTLTTFSDNWLGIAENADSQFELYPNPFSESATLRLKSSGNEIFEISILDLTGRKVANTLESVNGQIQIQRNQLNAGVYFIQVKMADRIENLRVVVR
jgi:uncharacterized repeat protein (TIGR01451 family)